MVSAIRTGIRVLHQSNNKTLRVRVKSESVAQFMVGLVSFGWILDKLCSHEYDMEGEGGGPLSPLSFLEYFQKK